MPEYKGSSWFTKIFGRALPLPQYQKKSDSQMTLIQGEKGVFVQMVEASAQKAVTITPNDTTSLTGGATKGLYLGASGNVAVTMADGSNVTFTALASGVVHPISVTKVKATGTTATNIIAVY